MIAFGPSRPLANAMASEHPRGPRLLVRDQGCGHHPEPGAQRHALSLSRGARRGAARARRRGAGQAPSSSAGGADTRRGPGRPPASRWRGSAHGHPAIRRRLAPAGMLSLARGGHRLRDKPDHDPRRQGPPGPGDDAARRGQGRAGRSPRARARAAPGRPPARRRLGRVARRLHTQVPERRPRLGLAMGLSATVSTWIATPTSPCCSGP